MNPQSPSKFKMDYYHKLTLSPLQKYVMYNRFPWKMLIHVLLLVLTTYQVLQMIQERTTHTRAEHVVLKKILLGIDDDSDTLGLYNLQDFSDSLTNMAENLNNLDELLIQQLDLNFVQYSMDVYYKRVNDQIIDGLHYELNFQEGFIYPFFANDTDSIKDFLSNVRMFQINGQGILNLVNYDNNPKPDACVNWTFAIQYQLQTYASLTATISTDSKQCFNENLHEVGENLVIIHIMVLLLAVTGLILSWKHVYSRGAEYMHQRETYRQTIMDQQSVNDDNQSINQQNSISSAPFGYIKDAPQQQQLGHIHFIDTWFLLGVLGNFVQLIASTMAIVDSVTAYDLTIFQFQESLLGIGCMIAWFMMLKYLEYNPNINLMTNTLQLSGQNILMFLLGVLPFFFGFVFLGQCIFWRYDKFSSTLNSILTLFSLANGDIVSDTFNDTWAQGIVGQIFLLSFLILFFTAFQNVFITIVMEGYEENKRSKFQQRFLKEQEDRFEAFKATKIEDLSDLEEEKQGTKKVQQEVGIAEYNDDKDMIIGKLKLNANKLDKMIDEMDTLLEEIDKSKMTNDDKIYLFTVFRENVDNISKNIQFQMNNISM